MAKETIEILEQKQTEFEKAVRPLMEYLAKNHNPYATIIVNSLEAELVESKNSYTTAEFIVD